MAVSRRQFLHGATAAGAMSFSSWLATARAADKPFVRSSANTNAGQKALVSYRKAVAEMVKLSEADPRDPIGWVYQYKLHKYPDDWDLLNSDEDIEAAQAAQLDEIFGVGTPERAMAKRTLGTCHIAGRSDFWPWHRMYLFYFERICRELSGDAEFALPYWGYTDPLQRTLPEEFRKPVGKAANALWHERRKDLNVETNPSILPSDEISFDYLDSDDFWQAHGQVESQPHGAIHVYLGQEDDGKTYDMTFVGTAARDPIFWLHHCEIDRSWEYWLAKTGGKNPTDVSWLQNDGNPENGYLFVDEHRQHVLMNNADVLNTTSVKGQLGYRYDELPKEQPMVVATSAQEGRTVIAELPQLVVGPGRSDAIMEAKIDLQTFSASVMASGNAPQIFLTIGEVKVASRVPMNIGIYINLPSDISGTEAKHHLAAVVSTFGMAPHAGHQDHQNEPRRLSFNATMVFSELAARGQLATIRLSGIPTSAATEQKSVIFSDVRFELSPRRR